MKKGLTIATTMIKLFTQSPLSSVIAQGLNPTTEMSSSKDATSSTAKKATKAETGMDSFRRYKYRFYG